MTNFEKIKEKIKTISVKKMARFLECHTICCDCPVRESCDRDDHRGEKSCADFWQGWLESEAEEDVGSRDK